MKSVSGGVRISEGRAVAVRARLEKLLGKEGEPAVKLAA